MQMFSMQPHIPIQKSSNPYAPHLVERRSNGHDVSVNNLVAKWRRSADSLLCLPSPSPFQSPMVMFHFPTLGGGMRLVFWHSLIHDNKRTWGKEGVFWLSSPSHVLTRFLQIICCRGLSQTWCSLGHSSNYCALISALGLTVLLFNQVYAWPMASGAKVESSLWNLSSRSI